MNTTIESAAIALGMTRARNKKWGPCPACKDDSKLPAVQIGFAWACFRCGAKGDAVDLVSYAINGCKGREAGPNFRAVLDWFENQRIVLDRVQHDDKDDDWQPSRVPENELREWFRGCTPMSKTTRKDVLGFMDRRGYPATVHGWVAPPHLSTRWWPPYFAQNYPVVVPAFTARGELAGVHGRSVSMDGKGDKTRWAKGYESSGLFFADYIAGLPFLRGQCKPDRIVFVEGITDFLALTPSASGSVAILGIESGSARALKLLPDLDGVEIFSGVDPDQQGDKYHQLLVNELSPHEVRRIPVGLRTGA